MADDAPQKKKIAILGGGMGALTAAWYLSDEHNRDKYDLTVYQMGWRLGGKGASGRNLNEGMGNRIEEHGIHFFFGFYENAFYLMNQCYEELNTHSHLRRSPGDPMSSCFSGPNPAFRRIRRKSGNRANITLMERNQRRWKRWETAFPNSSGLPGRRAGAILNSGKNCSGRRELFGGGINWLEKFHSEKIAPQPGSQSVPRLVDVKNEWTSFLEKENISSFTDGEDLFSVDLPDNANLLHFADALLDGKNDIDPKLREVGIHFALDSYVRHLSMTKPAVKKEKVFANCCEGNFSLFDEARRAWLVAAFMGSFFLAMARDNVLNKGFASIEDKEFRAWLKDSGRAGQAVTEIPFVQALYTMGYSYMPENILQPEMGAGTAARIVLRLLFDFRGSIAWKMQAGMGDTVFAPLYLVLKERGVKFRFFHRVDHLKTGKDADGKPVIDEIVLQKQVGMADTAKDLSDYEPLVDVPGRNGSLLCWPTEPNYFLPDEPGTYQIKPDQAEKLQKLKREKNLDLESMWIPWAKQEEEISLKHRTNTKKSADDFTFDEVILGISIGAFPTICKELIDESDAWKQMTEKINTIETTSVQLWPLKTSRAFGWMGAEPPSVMTYQRPFDTWFDFSHLKDLEDLEKNGVQHIAYFQEVLKQTQPPKMFFEKGFDPEKDSLFPSAVRNNARDCFRDNYLKDSVRRLWPRTRSRNSFAWGWLYDSKNRVGETRLDWHYFRVNHNPSDKYVLWKEGTLKYRMRADESGYANLTLAGDWTRTGLDAGSIEAACMSGMQAARAISRYPENVYGENF